MDAFHAAGGHVMFSATNLHLGVQLPVIEIKVENKKKKNKCSAADYESLKKTR